jgi:hypothetical protein
MATTKGTGFAEELLLALYAAEDEEQVEVLVKKHSLGDGKHWRPLNGDRNNASIIHNQQASEIGALVEKLTNSIDAVLMRAVLEKGIDPRSPEAPKTMDEAVKTCFGSKLWTDNRAPWSIAEKIQMHPGTSVAGKISPVIYDDGEGQRPEDFESTFLSLVRGNKAEVRFLQGLFNMGGTGALSFCGERHYQLLVSRRFDDERRHCGFTLVRRHPFVMSEVERERPRSLWYEYLVLQDQIPRFTLTPGGLDLGLRGRKFETGTVIKLYSYQFQRYKGNITQEIGQVLSEYLAKPALPMALVERKERYPDSKRREMILQGIQRKVQEIEWKNLVEFSDDGFEVGIDSNNRVGVELYVFRGGDENRKTVKNGLKRTNRAIVFTINGQVHGGWTGGEVISRHLKMNLLKDDILAFVDCTKLAHDLRDDIFMSSRDRLRDNKSTDRLREALVNALRPRLAPIHDRRVQAIGAGSSGKKVNRFLEQQYKELRLGNEVQDLLKGHLGKLMGEQDGSARGTAKPGRPGRTKPGHTRHRDAEEPVELPKRSRPTVLRLRALTGRNEETPAAKVAPGGQGTIRFKTDANDDFFTRAHSPGSLRLQLLNRKGRPAEGSSPVVGAAGSRARVEDLLNVEPSGPEHGEIRVRVQPSEALAIGEALHVRATLNVEGQDCCEENFWVRVVERPPRGSDEPEDEQEDRDRDDLGLPECVLVKREVTAGDEAARYKSWEDIASGGITMNEHIAVWPNLVDGKLTSVMINLDSANLQAFLQERRLDEMARKVIVERYWIGMYLHAVVLGTSMIQAEKKGEPRGELDVSDLLKDLMNGSYANLILRFDAEKLVAMSSSDDP